MLKSFHKLFLHESLKFSTTKHTLSKVVKGKESKNYFLISKRADKCFDMINCQNIIYTYKPISNENLEFHIQKTVIEIKLNITRKFLLETKHTYYKLKVEIYKYIILSINPFRVFARSPVNV